MAEVNPLKLLDQGSGVGVLAEFDTGDTLPSSLLGETLAALSGLSTQADRLAYFTGPNGEQAIAQFTAQARTLLAAESTAAQRAAMAINIGSPYALASGTANALVLTTSARYTPKLSLSTGDQVRFRASATNSGAASIDWDGNGGIACRTVTGVPLPAGYIRTDVDTVATYNGANFVLQREIERGVSFGGFYTLLSDGTAICTAQLGGGTAIAATYNIQGLTVYRQRTIWTFPLSFVANPAIGYIQGQNTDDSFQSSKYRALSASSVTLDSTSLTSFTVASNLSPYVSAAGRWY